MPRWSTLNTLIAMDLVLILSHCGKSNVYLIIFQILFERELCSRRRLTTLLRTRCMEFFNSTLWILNKGDGPDVHDQADQSGMHRYNVKEKQSRPSETRVRLSQMMGDADSEAKEYGGVLENFDWSAIWIHLRICNATSALKSLKADLAMEKLDTEQ